MSVELGREADNGYSLARLKPMNQVGGKADTAFLFGNGAEGVVAVEPEAVFHGWRKARRECLPGGTTFSCLYPFSDSGETATDSAHEEHELRIGLREDNKPVNIRCNRFRCTVHCRDSV